MPRKAASVTVDSAKFNQAAERLIATSKKSIKENLREQGKIIVVEAAKITPPNKNFKWNKKGGELSASNDLSRLFVNSKAKDAETNILPIHRKARNRSGRVAKQADKVKAAKLALYKKQVLANVGKMAAGWKSAASQLGTKLPAWITRHSRPGYAKYSQQGSRGTLELTNAGVYASKREGVQKRLSAVLAKRASAINKRVEYYLKQNARSSGFKVA